MEIEQILSLPLMQGIYLSLGTNLGDRESNLSLAQSGLLAKGVSILKVSSIYETAAWGREDQPDFLNLVIEVDSQLAPVDLLKVINQVEKEMGRIRFEKWGERLIDIDILYYQNEIINEPELIIPHPEIQDRKFVLEPMVELNPTGVHPKLRKSQKQLLAECKDVLEVSIIDLQ